MNRADRRLVARGKADVIQRRDKDGIRRTEAAPNRDGETVPDDQELALAHFGRLHETHAERMAADDDPLSAAAAASQQFHAERAAADLLLKPRPARTKAARRRNRRSGRLGQASPIEYR